MGYTSSIKFKDKDERDKMEIFIHSNGKLLNQLSLLNFYLPSRREKAVFSENTSPKKNFLEFHYTITPEYIWDLCAWMAVKSSVRNKAGNAFYYYENQALQITHDIHHKKHITVDLDGLPVKSDSEKLLAFKTLNIQPQYDEQKKLMTQLNNHWNQLKLTRKASI